MLRFVARLAAATFVVAAAGLVVPAPADAAVCSTASGVTVVVDFRQLGGGVPTFCDSGGAGENAEEQFADAGFSLTLVDGEDFVCRIDDKPVTDCSRTPPANAYWSLWWSDGKSGEWKYSSVAGKALKVPDGGYVAFSWQGQTSQAKPRVTPVSHSTSATSSAPASSATAQPTAPHSAGSHTSGSPGPASSVSTEPSDPGSTSSDAAAAPTSRDRQASGHDRQKASRTSKTTSGSSKSGSRRSGQAAGPVAQVASGTGDAAGSGSGGLPGWVPPVAIVVLFAGTGAVLLARRRSSGGG